MGGLFSSPPSPPKPPKVTDPAVQQAEEDAKKRAALARGRSATILTTSGGSGLGVVGS